jgi:hypothetical protein
MRLHYEIVQSESQEESPLEWQSPDERGAWFVMSHKRYNLPNELDVDFEEYDSWNELAEKASDKPYMFVRWYEHSGISVQLRDEPNGQDWDAGIVGVIFGNTTEDIKREFATWQCYVEGDVWDIRILDEKGEFVDGCAGFYGYKYAEEEAEAMLKQAQIDENERAKQTRQAQKEVKQAITLANKHGYILAKEV